MFKSFDELMRFGESARRGSIKVNCTIDGGGIDRNDLDPGFFYALLPIE